MGRLLGRENVWVKLSSIYRLSLSGPPYNDLGQLAREAISIAPERVLWGSDWPYPCHEQPVDMPAVLAAVLSWCGGPEGERRLFVDNPERLFGFPSRRAVHRATAPEFERLNAKSETTMEENT